MADDVEMLPHHIYVIVICVLGVTLLYFFICTVFLFCRKKNRNRSVAQCRSRPCSCDSCTSTQPSCDRVFASRDTEAGVYPPHHFALPNHFSRHIVPSHQSIDHLCHCQANALHLPSDEFPVNRSFNRHTGQAHTLPRSMPVINPAYQASLSESDCVSTNNIDVTPGELKNLFEVTERSVTQTVCGKLLVSIARRVDHKGDVLYLDNMGISLHVPEGAVKRGDSKMIVLVLNWDLSDNPQMKKEESLVSPVVYVGPHGLKLDKPCILTFRHCAFNPHQIKVMRSETDLTDQKSWATLCNQTDDSGTCYLTPDECQINIDTFTLYTCVQAPLGNCLGKKWLQIAVFACPLRKEINHHQVRLYFLNKTNCALQWAIQNEANFGGKLICPEKVFLFDGNDLDMFTQTRYVSTGWELVGDENSEKISFLQIWHGQCPHISVCFRRSDSQTSKSTSVAIEMSLHVFTFQQTLQENGEKIFIQVFEDDRTPVTGNEIRCNHQIDIQINNYGDSHGKNSKNSHSNYGAESPNGPAEAGVHKSMSESVLSHGHGQQKPNSEKVKLVINNRFNSCSNMADHTNELLTSGVKSRLFPQSLRNRLILLLDPLKSPCGNDWRDLAAKLNLDECIPKLQSYEHPTEKLLCFMESEGKSLSEVIALFHEIRREDCVDEIVNYCENAMKKDQELSRNASENTDYCREQNGYRLLSEESSWTGSLYMDRESANSYNSSLKTNSDTFNKDILYSKD